MIFVTDRRGDLTHRVATIHHRPDTRPYLVQYIDLPSLGEYDDRLYAAFIRRI
jgi:hypothetical protein